MEKISVGVLRGGPSLEYSVSLETGKHIVSVLPKDRYTILDILIDQNGAWHLHGRPIEPHRALQQIDVAFNALHGVYGEDGTVQRLLSAHRVPYTGSDSVASAIAFNKHLAKQIARKVGIATPDWTIVPVTDRLREYIQEIHESHQPPYIVKPTRSGSSIGVYRADGYKDLSDAFGKTFEHTTECLVESFIEGREATCGVIEGFRGDDYYATLPTEIVRPVSAPFFDYASKYNGQSDEICPAPFPPSVNKKLAELAVSIHKAVGARHYSRSDFIVTPRNIYFLEINTLPGLTKNSLMPKALSSAGSSVAEFGVHVLNLATNAV